MKTSVRVALIGARGRMGQTIADLAKDDPKIDIVGRCDLGDAIERVMKDCDVAIDFSHAGAINEVCSAALRHRKALVIGTTGHSAEQRQFIEKMAGSLPADRVLATAVEDGQPQPQMWSLEPSKGRVFVAIPGHFSWTFDDSLFRVLLLRGIAWAAREPVDRFNDLVWVGADVSR